VGDGKDDVGRLLKAGRAHHWWWQASRRPTGRGDAIDGEDCGTNAEAKTAEAMHSKQASN
jgi:hypothetical protein